MCSHKYVLYRNEVLTQEDLTSLVTELLICGTTYHRVPLISLVCASSISNDYLLMYCKLNFTETPNVILSTSIVLHVHLDYITMGL